MSTSDAMVSMVGIGVIVCLISRFIYGQYLKGLRGNINLIWLGACALCLWPMLYRLQHWQSGGWPRTPFWGETLDLLASLVLVFAGVALIYMLYRKWVDTDLSEEERTPGAVGMRAWLRSGNLVCCGLIAWGAWQGYGYSIWGILFLSLVAVMVYPLIITLMKTSPTSAAAPDNISAERERVFKLLEAGKITAEESAQLLTALNESAPAPTPAKAPATPARKLMLAGAALILIAFFLPWFAINPGQEMKRVTQQIGQIMPTGWSAPANVSLPMMNINTDTLYIAGGNVGHGLGWLVLLLGLGAVGLPLASLGLDRATQNKAALAALGVGALILIYLLTQNLRFMHVGFILTMVGYGMAIMGALKESQGSLPVGAWSGSVQV